MRRNKALMLATGILSTALFLSIPSAIARADSFISVEQGVAGISAIIDSATDQQLADAYNASVSKEIEIKSPYENLGVCIAEDYVNIRKEPSTDSEIVGRLYRGCAADILKRLDGDWVKVKSGKVEGYIASNFLVIGAEAESMVEKYATKLATVNGDGLRVREERNTDSRILTFVPKGETYVVTKEYKDWIQLLLGEDDGDSFTGYLSKEFLTIEVKFKYAISMKEILEQEKRQREAEEAEAERKAKLAAEKEAAKAEAAKAEAANNAKDDTDHSSSDNNSGNSSSESGNSSSHSSLRQQVVDYALKFVGNPYEWGGTSLTRGADCSGFVGSIYADFGYTLKRTSYDQAANSGYEVSESELLPGDLLFYLKSNGQVGHVAMYIGDGRIVHAANERQGIITSNYKYRDIYKAKRIIN